MLRWSHGEPALLTLHRPWTGVGVLPLPGRSEPWPSPLELAKMPTTSVLSWEQARLAGWLAGSLSLPAVACPGLPRPHPTGALSLVEQPWRGGEKSSPREALYEVSGPYWWTENSLGLPDPAWLNRKYRQQAGTSHNRPGWHTQLYAELASFQHPACSKKVLKLKCPSRSPGWSKMPAPGQTHSYALLLQEPRELAGACRLHISLLHQAKSLLWHEVCPPRSPVASLLRRAGAGTACTSSHSLLIQRIQKKKIAGMSFPFLPLLSSGLYFFQFLPQEFILTVSPQQ